MLFLMGSPRERYSPPSFDEGRRSRVILYGLKNVVADDDNVKIVNGVGAGRSGRRWGCLRFVMS
jgi:hypothetical protein